jgi:hypothetical protein
MKVAEPGYYVREGFYLNYEVAGEDFRQFFPAVLEICAGDRGPRRPNGECKPPKNWEALNDQM